MEIDAGADPNFVKEHATLFSTQRKTGVFESHEVTGGVEMEVNIGGSFQIQPDGAGWPLGFKHAGCCVV